MTMESNTEARRICEEYQTKEFPIKYHYVLCDPDLQPELIEYDEVILSTILEILSGIRKGCRMIDFGCGPTVHLVASASRYYQEIISADYSDYNIAEVRKWLRNDDQSLDWSLYLNLVAKLEGYRNIKKGTKEIEKRIRSSIKNVIRCDILNDPPIQEKYGKFDLLLTSYVIESVCTTTVMYEDCVKKLRDLIKPDGTLIMIAALGASSYIAHKNLHQLPIDEMLIRNTLGKCGMKIKTWRFIESNYADITCRCSGIVVLSADRN